MKRIMIVGTAVLVIAAMMTVLVGCGEGDVDKAKSIIKEADEMFDKALAAGEPIGEYEAAFAAYVTNPNSEDAQKISANMEQITQAAQQMKDEMLAAMEKYQEVDPLEDVGNYQTYKGYMANAITQYVKVANSIMEAMKNLEAGQNISEQLTALQGEYDKAEKLLENAKSFEEQKDLL